jgi:UDP-N-acetylglucosamine--N-acetylmuramyl-(pentapeptide) pyrophosphoryl-undecaprenol N-acetylglucosamine transferase
MDFLLTRKIAIIAGGTGGHIFPAIALYEKISRTNNECKLFINGKFTHEKSIPFPASYLGSFYFFLNELSTFDVIITFGAYITVGAIFASYILGKEMYVHEQNGILGRANKLAVLLGAKILSAFNLPKSHWIGMPISEMKYESTPGDYILILSSSMGSVFFDKYVIPIVLQNTNEKVYAQGNIKTVESYVKTIRTDIVIQEYFNNFEFLIANARLIIAPAGASMISYIHLYKKPAILIPSPRKTDNHHWYNALYSDCFFLNEDSICNLPHVINMDLKYKEPKKFKLFI